MAKPGAIDRAWYILDAAGKPMGRVAATAAVLLRGKHKAEYTPNQDCGDFVVIVNTGSVALTGRKAEQKYYRTHSGYPGHLKETKYRLLLASKPDLAMRWPCGACCRATRLQRPAQAAEAVRRRAAHPRGPKAR